MGYRAMFGLYAGKSILYMLVINVRVCFHYDDKHSDHKQLKGAMSLFGLHVLIILGH